MEESQERIEDGIVSRSVMKQLEKDFFSNCVSTYKAPIYNEEEELEVDIKQLKKYLHEIRINKNLKILSINGQVPINIIKQLSLISQLEELELSNYSDELLLKDTFILLKNLKNLKILTIHNSDIKNIPKEIGELKTLKELRIFFTHIKELPKEIGDLESLKKLDIPNNYLCTLPKSMQKLQQLDTMIIYEKLVNNALELKKSLPNLYTIYNMDDNHKNILKNIN